MCRCLDCRFRTVLLYTQHGQPSHPWLTWPLCSSMTLTCPKQTVPPSHSPFWLECCLCGECKAKGRNIAFKIVVFIPFFSFVESLAGLSWKTLCLINMWGSLSPFTPWWSGPWRGYALRITRLEILPAITSLSVRSLNKCHHQSPFHTSKQEIVCS